MSNTVTDQPNEIQMMLESFVEHENDCPIRGRYRAEQRLQSMWKLGFVEGASACLGVVLNRMCKPGTTYTLELIRTSVVIPLMRNGDLDAAERKMHEMIARSWSDAA